MRTHVWFFLTGFEVVMIKYSSLIYQFSSGNITKYVNRKQRRLPVEHLNPVSISNIKAKSAVKLVWSEGSLLSCDWLAWQEEVRRVKTIGYRYTIHLIWIYTTTCLQKNKVLSGLTCRQLERVFKYGCSLWQWVIYFSVCTCTGYSFMSGKLVTDSGSVIFFRQDFTNTLEGK